MKLKNIVTEAGLARLWSHMNNHDTGTISAFRYARDCGKGNRYTKTENLKRNASLLAKLQSKKYNAIAVKGSYIENFGASNAREVNENAFLVIDVDDKGNLLNDLKALGQEFEQDSVLFIQKGANLGILYGTSACPESYPGMGNKIVYNTRFLGKDGEFFTRINGRPFSYLQVEPSELSEHSYPKGFFGKWPCNTIANKKWEDIELRKSDKGK